MCTKYWLTACSSFPGKEVVRLTDRPAMAIVVDWDVKQQNKLTKAHYKHNLKANKIWVVDLLSKKC